MLQFATALTSDAEDIEALLRTAELPLPAPIFSASFLLARENGKSVGCIAFERFGSDALLRSHVVLNEARGKGIGQQLVSQLLEQVARKDIQTLYLLTLDAMTYFARFDFVAVQREELPTALLESQEFLIHSCDNAVCMRRPIHAACKQGEPGS